MSYFTFHAVVYFLLCQYVSAYMYGYPGYGIYPSGQQYSNQYPYQDYSMSAVPYPHQSQFPSYPYSGSENMFPGQSSFPVESTYDQMPPMESYPSMYPSGGSMPPMESYPSMFSGGPMPPMELYPPMYSGGQMPPMESYPSMYPSGGQMPSMEPYPSMYSSGPVPSPYGQIPVEIIDVNDPQTRFSYNNNPYPYNYGTNFPKPTAPEVPTADEKNQNNTNAAISKTKKVIDFNPDPVKSTSVVKTDPLVTQITRTFDPKSKNVIVNVQTSRPPLVVNENRTNNIDDNKENNETTTKFNLFG